MYVCISFRQHSHNLGDWLLSISAKLHDDDVLNKDNDVMMAAPPSQQKSVISSNDSFSPLLLRDELPRSKIAVFHSLWSRPISYSMKLDPTTTRSIWLLTVVIMCLLILLMTLPQVSSLNWKVLLGDRFQGKQALLCWFIMHIIRYLNSYALPLSFFRTWNWLHLYT